MFECCYRTQEDCVDLKDVEEMYVRSLERAAGVTPERREAAPMFSGWCAERISMASSDRAGIVA